MIEKRESSPTTLLSSTSDIEILNPMLPTEELSQKHDTKSMPNGVSTNPLAKLAAACTSLCNELKPKTTSPSFSSVRTQFAYPPAPGAVLKPTVGQPLLPSSLISNLPNVVSALQTQHGSQASIDSSYLLAQELLAKQNTISALPAQNLTALDTLAALSATSAAKPQQSLPLTTGTSNLDYLTKIYLQTIAAKKELSSYPYTSLDLVNSALAQNEKLLSPGSASGLQPGVSHLHNGVDYRLCPCSACQTLRLNVLALQQQLAKQPAAPALPPAPTQPQQHYLLPQKNPLTGAVQYIPVCTDQNNCSLCAKTSPVNNNNYLKQPSSASPTGLTAEQYLAALTAQTHTAKPLTTPSPNLDKASPDFSAPLQIQTSPSPTATENSMDITCSWTENGAPCGRKFGTEEQLFDHIKKVHTSNSNTVPKQASPSQNISTDHDTQSNPLASLKNLSRKVLPEATSLGHLSAARFHPYARPSIADSRLNASANHIAASRPSALPLLNSTFGASQLPVSALSTLNLPGVAGSTGTGLPFSLSTNATSQFVSANQMSSLLFAAAAR